MHSATGLRRSRPVIHVLICLLLILAGAVGASLVQTGGGHIAVQGLGTWQLIYPVGRATSDDADRCSHCSVL